jgi:CheY-like chemotaxis protein
VQSMHPDETLLLVDDDETTRDLLSLLLEAEGWQVTTVESGDAAVAYVLASVPHVILSDLQMPGLCGTAMATAVREACGDNVPLLLAMTATVREAAPEGFDALLVKPFSPGAVRACCEELRAGINSTSSAPEPGIDTAEPVIDTAVLQRLQASMPADRLRALYDFAMADAEDRVTRMAAAASEGDDATVRSQAHALKGSCGMVGATRLQAMAATVETKGLATGVTGDAAGTKPLTTLHPFAHFREAIADIRHMLEKLHRG